jgi:hypothetical protein
MVPKKTEHHKEVVFESHMCDTIKIHNNLGSIAETVEDTETDYTISLF